MFFTLKQTAQSAIKAGFLWSLIKNSEKKRKKWLLRKNLCGTFCASFTRIDKLQMCRGGEIGRRTALRGQRGNP